MAPTSTATFNACLRQGAQYGFGQRPMTISATPRLHGFRGAAKLSGRALRRAQEGLARLERAIGQFMNESCQHRRARLSEINTPLLVRNEVMFSAPVSAEIRDDQFWAIRASCLLRPAGSAQPAARPIPRRGRAEISSASDPRRKGKCRA